MTQLLEKAITQISKLTVAEQNAIATMILEELVPDKLAKKVRENIEMCQNEENRQKNAMIVTDTSAIVAIMLEEPEKQKILDLTQDANLIAPGCLYWEIGNALSAHFKRGKFTLDEAISALQTFQNISLTYIDVQLESTLQIAKQLKIYAYDAYFLNCALQYDVPLISLDKALCHHATTMGIDILEVHL